MGYALLAGAVISAGTAIYSSQQQKKAAEKQAGAIKSGTKGYEAVDLPDPKQLDYRKAQTAAIDIPFDNLEYATRLSRAINTYNYAEAMKYYQKIQPQFKALQAKIGENAISYARGDLPDDVVGQIQRRAAEKGIQGGYGYGSQGAKSGALANINLRNLGLTSLDLSKYGTELGMRVNSQAQALLPNLSSPKDWLFNPGQILDAEKYNVGTQNQFILRQNELDNNAANGNTELANSLNQAAAQSIYNGEVRSAQAIQQAGSAIGGALTNSGGLFGGGGGANTAGAANYGQFNTQTQPWRSNATGAYGLA